MFDVVFVGGGLAAGLAALQLHSLQPHLKCLIIEKGAKLGGNHTWSFFKTDLSETQFQWVQPLIEHSWPHYEVRFPDFERRINNTYCSISSTRFHDYLTEYLPEHALMLNTSISSLSVIDVTLAGGRKLNARCVIDCRGPSLSPYLTLGFQKFTGQTFELTKPHGLQGPIIMDATIPQDGDYRFFYTLPLSPTRVLIEDTRYSNHAAINTDADRHAILAYAAAQKWEIQDHLGEEQGSLPIALGGNIKAFWNTSPLVARLGLRAALFHSTTGYSFPNAVCTAELIGQCNSITTYQSVFKLIRNFSVSHWSNQGFLRLLNRMMFLAGKPNDRYLVMLRFYGLPEPLIERFYAGTITWLDKVRILSGKPPVPVFAALKCILENSATSNNKWRIRHSKPL